MCFADRLLQHARAEVALTIHHSGRAEESLQFAVPQAIEHF